MISFTWYQIFKAGLKMGVRGQDFLRDTVPIQ